MLKTIYCYFNDNDLKYLLETLYAKGIFLHDNNHKQLDSLPHITYENLIEIELYNEDKGQVCFSPCIVVNGYLQCGMFWLKQSNDTTSCKLYSLIKKHIKSCFTYSKENACYYGNGIFRDWCDRKYRFPLLLKYEKYELENSKIESLFAELKKLNMGVKANQVRIRDADRIDFNTPNFIIYCCENQLLRTIVNKSIIRYEYDSVCIFAYKNETKSVYTLMLDSRLINDYPDIKTLFEQIKTMQEKE